MPLGLCDVKYVMNSEFFCAQLCGVDRRILLIFLAASIYVYVNVNDVIVHLPNVKQHIVLLCLPSICKRNILTIYASVT